LTPRRLAIVEGWGPAEPLWAAATWKLILAERKGSIGYLAGGGWLFRTQCKKGLLRIAPKLDDSRGALSNQFLDVERSAVSERHPNGLGRMTVEQASLMKVAVFRNDGEAVFQRVTPDRFVLAPAEPGLSDINALHSTSLNSFM